MKQPKSKVRGIAPNIKYTTPVSRGVIIEYRRTNGSVIYENKKPHTYIKSEKFDFTSTYFNSLVFDSWCDQISAVRFDSLRTFIQSFDYFAVSGWEVVLKDFVRAIEDYQADKTGGGPFSTISEDSARSFLVLIPLLASHHPRIYIDATNGHFNADMPARDNGILSAQVSGNGHIFYSYVAQNNKIFKITGSAKFKNYKDFIKFNKILQML